MHKPIPVTAIFDIGKTNKKFLLFDENYAIVYKRQINLAETKDDDGEPCEDLSRLVEWLKEEFQKVCENPKFRITALNFSTYGASLVHLDDTGNVITPLYNYLKSYPEDLAQRFYESYGGEEQISLETASPPMGMLNSGLQLYWIKYKKPELFANLRYSLHFPQYVSWLFTKQMAAECTSIGCHTALWDFKKNRYHRWLAQEGLADRFPEIRTVSHTQEINYQDHRFNTGLGIHDSSAALVPWLYAMDEPFLLLSTGTWNITLNPFSNEPLTFAELKRDCLCYLNIYGEQVKASRFFAGNEYRHQKQKLLRHFNREDQEHVEIDTEWLRNLIDDSGNAGKLKLETAYSSGPYPSGKPGEWPVERFSSYEKAFHQLMLDLVSIQAESILLAQGSNRIENIIITGGFSNNDFFVKLLASRFPGKKVFTATMPHASAFGAALVMGHKAEGGSGDLKDLLGLKLHYPLPGLELARYSWNDE